MRLKKPIAIALAAVIAILTAAIISAIVCSQSLKVTEYTVELRRLESDIRVVCISDLHGKEYGDDNEKLLALIAEQKPDAVFVLGDMINADADEKEISRFLELMTRLTEISQVFFSPGNHEMDYIIDSGTDLMALVSDTGATALCDGYVEAEIGGNTVRVGGSLGHYHRYEWTEEQSKNPPDYRMEKQIGADGTPSIVMRHMPESLVTDPAAQWWTGDLYLSGHTHGGVIVIPGIGGVFAPTQGLFPKYDSGKFNCFGKDIVITSGLSGYGAVPRIFNRPEICLITIIP